VNGTGDVIWDERKDEQGRSLGRETRKDQYGNELHRYHAPEGFRNMPSYDHVDNWVMVDDRGDVVRDRNGCAVSIREGQAIVCLPDNSYEVLADEYAQYVFSQAHDSTDTEVEE
jgi:hypothetical protein